jgi:hypothetical protein
MDHEKLIAFLEEEARVLRNRIAGLEQRDVVTGVHGDDGAPSRGEQLEAETRARLHEIEERLKTLKQSNAA